MRELAVFSGLRIALFAAAFAAAWLAGARGLLAVVLGGVVSLALSYVLLRRQRDAAARALFERRQEARDRGDPFGDRHADGADEAAEDAADEAARAAAGGDASQGRAPS